MRALKWLAIALGAYLAVVVAFECVVGFMGKRHADAGLEPGERWIVLTTNDPAGSRDTVIYGAELDGKLYVSANHWPRTWYERAVANPDVEVTRAGEKRPYRATPIDGAERDRLEDRYQPPFAIRVLAGFPPRAYLRLDPR